MRTRLLNSKPSYPVLEPVSSRPDSSLGASFPLPANDGEAAADADALTLHRASSRVWSEIRGAIRAIGRNSRSSSQGSTEWCPGEASPAPNQGKTPVVAVQGGDSSSSTRKPKRITPRELVRRLRLDTLGLAPNTTVVLRNSPLKHRGSLQVLASGTDSDSSSDRGGSWSSAYSSRLTSPDTSTRKTSFDSRFSASPSAKGSSPKGKHSRRHRWTRSSPEGGALDTIEESGVDQAQPTILTVERAAAAKIYLETYFDELISKPQSRSVRRQYLESQLYYSPHLSIEQKEAIRRSFYHQENCHLRETRVFKSQTQFQFRRRDTKPTLARYEPIKVLGKGSFGIVRLVREKSNSQNPYTNQVYAMKVIRKSDMLRSSQEGHLRAERDFLVASEGSSWVVPLVASFQDLTSLYLVMEYMPGGDFLGLLIRENVLDEGVTRFYVAEMILAVEEAHRLRFIHRDIKPDNFLISSSGHLKISDFGLAFDGHWSHDASYYNYHRYSILRKLGIHVDGDQKDQEEGKTAKGHAEKTQALTAGLGRHSKQDLGKDEDLSSLLWWRNRYGNRTRANSIVGTSQYMAPESIGIILFECLYGHTPFLSDEGRKPTKDNIMKHRELFNFPLRPLVSDRCKDLMYRLIRDKETRLCSRRYQMLDRGQLDAARSTDVFGRYVFANDAEDIRAHRWFKNMPWDRLQTLMPPFIPQINSAEDTHYFDESEPMDYGSESSTEMTGPTPEQVRSLLRDFRPSIQNMAIHLVEKPYDSGVLRSRDQKIDRVPTLSEEEKVLLKRFVREYGRRVPRRPRDIILRDEKIKDMALEVRKQTAFMGYTWRRMRPGGYMMPKWVE